MFCSKQEINNQQRNQTHQSQTITKTSSATTSTKSMTLKQPESTDDTKQGYSSTSSAASSYFITETKSEIIQLQTNETQSRLNISVRSRSNSSASISKSSPVRSKLPNADSNENISKPTQPVTTIQNSNQSSSPNAKLPPIRHPKSKLIMKNIQNKQQQIISQQSVPTESNINQEAGNLIINALENEFETKALSNQDEKLLEKEPNSKIQRSSSSSILEKRPSQTKKSRPSSANAPVYKKLLPIEDPILQILDQLHKIIFITQMPPSGNKNFKRKLIDRYKRYLFSNKRSSTQIKVELMKLIKNSPELIDMEMIGLKSVQYYYNSSDTPNAGNLNIPTNDLDSNTSNLYLIINQNGITYEQLQIIIEELLAASNYHLENLKYLR